MRTPVTKPTREVRVAAQWWADRLARRDGVVDLGASDSEAFVLYAQTKIPPVTDAQVELFRLQLEAELRAMITHPMSGWDKAERQGPRWGAAFRTVSVDYGPCPILGKALAAAGLDEHSSSLLPLKTTMWVNPGQVMVRHGYNAAEQLVPLD